MSNPSVCFLSSVEISNINFRIEDNLGEAIHIHMGKVRLSISIKEFFVFAEGIMEAVQELFQVRHLEMGKIDIESLKQEWIDNYEKINMVKIEYAELESLYMKESYTENRAIKRIIPLKESGYIKILKGDKKDIDYYETPGKLEPSRKQKMDYIKQRLERDGYPLNRKLIFVDQEGYIYDGIKRASCLYYMYGGNKKIPILRVYLPKEKSIDEQREESERKVLLWKEMNISDKDYLEHDQMKDFKIDMGIKEFTKRLKKMQVPFFMIKRDKRNVHGELIAVATIVIEEGKLKTIGDKLSLLQCHSPFDSYRFLYTAQKPLCYLTKEGPILIFDRICCKNKFENDILPVDRHILKKSWQDRIWNKEWKCYFVGTEIYLLIIIMEALFEKMYFEQEDIEFIEQHKEIIYQSEFKSMLKLELYQYTEILVEYLLSHQYDKAVLMYDGFSSY